MRKNQRPWDQALSRFEDCFPPHRRLFMSVHSCLYIIQPWYIRTKPDSTINKRLRFVIAGPGGSLFPRASPAHEYWQDLYSIHLSVTYRLHQLTLLQQYLRAINCSVILFLVSYNSIHHHTAPNHSRTTRSFRGAKPLRCTGFMFLPACSRSFVVSGLGIPSSKEASSFSSIAMSINASRSAPEKFTVFFASAR